MKLNNLLLNLLLFWPKKKTKTKKRLQFELVFLTKFKSFLLDNKRSYGLIR